MSENLSGRTLGRYSVLEQLGRGGMAAVYRAYQPSLDRFVALKVIYPHLASDPELLERFTREARAVAILRHPNIVQVYDFDVLDGVAFITMEFIGGPTLKAASLALGRRASLLPLPIVGQVVGQLADALHYAHEQQLIHRDVKPANVILRRPSASGEQPLDDAALEQLVLSLTPSSVVLTDFGVARIIKDSVQQTATGTILGSPVYMSPEQGRGERVSYRSDIYSLGIVLYELLTGRVPFDADTPFAVVLKHISEPLPPPRSLRPDLPMGLERVLLKALAKDPAERFQDAAAFGAAVREQAGAGGASTNLRLATPANPGAPRETQLIERTAVLAQPAPAAPAKSPQRRVWLLPLVLLVVLLVGGFLLVRANRRQDGQSIAQTGVAVQPADLDARLATAQALAQEPGYYDDSSPVRDRVIAEVSAIIASAPQNIPALLLRAEAYSNARQYELATADCTAVLAIEPTNLDALLMRATIARDYMNLPAAALADFDAAVAAHPESQGALVGRLLVRASQGDRAGVLADAKKLVALAPDDPEYLSGRGFAYLNQGQNDAAMADFERAVLLGGDEALAARYGRGKLRLTAGQPAEALADLEAVAARSGDLSIVWSYFFDGYTLVHLELAQAYTALGRGAEIGPLLDQAVETNNSWYLPYLERARYLAANDNPAGAREDLRQALSLTKEPDERSAIEAELAKLP